MDNNSIHDALELLNKPDTSKLYDLLSAELQAYEKLKAEYEGLVWRHSVAMRRLRFGDVVPVTRCCDCKHAIDASEEVHATLYRCAKTGLPILLSSDYYCASAWPIKEKEGKDCAYYILYVNSNGDATWELSSSEDAMQIRVNEIVAELDTPASDIVVFDSRSQL